MKARGEQKYGVVIPGYQEQGRIGKVVAAVLAHCPAVIVVDDGSRDSTAQEAERAGAVVLRHERNKGKGEALRTGFRYACEQGFDYIITMDADGQHDPAELPQFVKAYLNTGIPVLVGNRMHKTKGMPAIRRWTNGFMSWYLSRRMGQYVPDTQNGYRLYRCDLLELVRSESRGFAAESEALLNLAEAGVKIGAVPVKTLYGGEKSKIRPVRDTIRFFAMVRRHERALRRARGAARVDAAPGEGAGGGEPPAAQP